ncbi:MAG TPA: sn-glycerol-3-phosphate ABC transporter ATP-binding protein UgpC [Acetobacteraceae bacterium]
MASLSLRGIIREYGLLRVIHGIDLDVAEGEFVVFVGPSGCGKSTLLRIIAGLDQPSGGDILLDGQRVNERSAADRGLAMVFQSYALYPHMTVRQNLAFGLENQRMPRAEIDRRIAEAARMLQIEPLLARRPGQLSGGQRQRVAIGRTVTREPGIFLFDEPLSNLDAELRVQMRVELSELHKRLRATMIYVTHDQTEAMTMADRIVVLRAGRVEQQGAPLELYNHPANRFVAGFIGSPRMNFLPARIAPGGVAVDGLAEIAMPGLAASPGEAVTLAVRPEHLGFVDEGGLPGTVQLVEQMGGESYIYMALANGERLTIRHPGQVRLRAGEAARATVLDNRAHLFRATEGEPAVGPA